jgi:6-phosphogluconate dehydrogenase
VVDSVLDSAGSKGTGKWTSQEVLDLGLAGFGFLAAVLARNVSAQKKNRVWLAKNYPRTSQEIQTKLTIEQLESALYISKILAYAQGYEILGQAAKEYAWKLDFKEISRIWEGGCIIRARFLSELENEYLQNPNLQSILLAENFSREISQEIENTRLVASEMVRLGLPIPAILSGISYFDSMVSEKLPANLLQAQRDFFGAHTFQVELDGSFVHHDWQA